MSKSPPCSFCAVRDDFSTYFECFGFHISALSLIFPGRWEWQKTWFRVHETLLGGVWATSASEASRCFWLASSSRRYFICFCFVLGVCGALMEAPGPFFAHPGHSFWGFVGGHGGISRPRRGARPPVCVWRCQSGLLGGFHASFWKLFYDSGLHFGPWGCLLEAGLRTAVVVRGIHPFHPFSPLTPLSARELRFRSVDSIALALLDIS